MQRIAFSGIVILAVMFSLISTAILASAASAPALSIELQRTDGLHALENGTSQNLNITVTYNASSVDMKIYKVTVYWNTSQLEYITVQNVEVYNTTQHIWVPVSWTVLALNKTAGYVTIAPTAQQSALVAATGTPPQAKLRVTITFTPHVNSSMNTTIQVSALTDDGTLSASSTIYIDAAKPIIKLQMPGNAFNYNATNGVIINGWIIPNNTDINITVCDDYGIAYNDIIINIYNKTGYKLTFNANNTQRTNDLNVSVTYYNLTPTWTEGGKTLAKKWLIVLHVANINSSVAPDYFNMTISATDAAGLNSISYRNYTYIDLQAPTVSIEANSINTGTVTEYYISDVNNTSNMINVTITDDYGWTLEEARELAELMINVSKIGIIGNYTVYEVINETKPNSFGRYTEIKIVYKVPVIDNGYINVSAKVEDLAGHSASSRLNYIYVVVKPPTIIPIASVSSVDKGRIYANGSIWYISNSTSSMTLMFNVTDIDNMLNASTIKVYLNGTEVSTAPATTGAQYQASLSLAQGNVFNVTIVAADYLRHVGKYTLMIVRDTVMPWINYTIKKLSTDNYGGAAGLLLSIIPEDNLAPTDTIKLYVQGSNGVKSYTINLMECNEPQLYNIATSAPVANIDTVEMLNAEGYCGFGKIILNVTKLAGELGNALNITVEVSDVTGNARNYTIAAGITAANSEYAFYLIRLYGGWNLISLPLVSKIDIAKLDNYLLSGSTAKITALYTYVNGTWLIAPRGFSYLEDGKGYFIYVKAPIGQLADVLVVCGTKHPVSTTTPAAPQIYEVYPGWNLVGVTYINGTIKPSKYFSSIKSILVGVWGWDPISQTWKLVYHEALNDTGVLVPGMGYFIYTTSSGVIVPPTVRLPS